MPSFRESSSEPEAIDDTDALKAKMAQLAKELDAAEKAKKKKAEEKKKREEERAEAKRKADEEAEQKKRDAEAATDKKRKEERRVNSRKKQEAQRMQMVEVLIPTRPVKGKGKQKVASPGPIRKKPKIIIEESETNDGDEEYRPTRADSEIESLEPFEVDSKKRIGGSNPCHWCKLRGWKCELPAQSSTAK